MGASCFDTFGWALEKGMPTLSPTPPLHRTPANQAMAFVIGRVAGSIMAKGWNAAFKYYKAWSIYIGGFAGWSGRSLDLLRRDEESPIWD